LVMARLPHETSPTIARTVHKEKGQPRLEPPRSCFLPDGPA